MKSTIVGYKIEKNIPFPLKSYMPIALKAIAIDMKPGDSVKVKLYSHQEGLRRAIQDRGFRAVTMVQKTGGYRVWCKEVDAK